MKKKYVKCLDGWRGIAIIFVLIYHTLGQYPDSELYLKTHDFLGPLGRRGVQIFFVLSGYLIIGNIYREIKTTKAFSIYNFFIKRVYRILPPFYFYLLICLIASFFGPKDLINYKELLNASIFMSYLPSGHINSYTSQIWSLCIEEYFYIIASTYFLFIGNKIKFKYSVLFFISFSFLAQILKKVFAIPLGFYNDLLEFRFMFMGGALAIIGENLPKKVSKLLIKFRFVIILSFIGLLFYQTPFYTLIFPIFVALTVHATTMKQTFFSKLFLENKALVGCGKISYSLYLWNTFFIPWEGYFFSEGSFKVIQQLPLNIFLSILVSIFSYKVIELPMISLGRSKCIKTPNA